MASTTSDTTSTAASPAAAGGDADDQAADDEPEHTRLSRSPHHIRSHTRHLLPTHHYPQMQQSDDTMSPTAAVDAPLKHGLQACVDGNTAAAMVAYYLSDAAFIYPITPSSTMGELADKWSCEGKLNLNGQTLAVTEMQSEGGAAGALHGSLVTGSLTTTFTASQGLLLMIPNMYKIAGELLPCVIHVAARAVAGQALSIFGEHSDVMACRQTGFAILSSHSVQEAHDMALIAHATTLKTRVPFLHFFDGFRTSHEISKIELLSEETMLKLIDMEALKEFRSRALNPMHPHQRGTSQGPDVYFQMVEAASRFHTVCPDAVERVMDEFSDLTGRHYSLFDYHGHPEAEHVVVSMGISAKVAEETVKHIVAIKGRKVGNVAVHLFMPWSIKHFLAALPVSAKRITVLDRTKEAGAMGEPLFMSVSATLQASESEHSHVHVCGGRYGLGSKDLTPTMMAAVFENMRLEEPRRRFTVGILDDVYGTSLPVHKPLTTITPQTRECVFWGLGSDGTVSANHAAVKIIGEHSGLYAQAYFHYDAHKSAGVTQSHLRFGNTPINAPYAIQKNAADYVAVHNETFAQKYNVAQFLHRGGVFVLNTHASTVDELEAVMPPRLRHVLAQKKAKLHVVDATQVALTARLGKRINTVMQTVFFMLSGVLPKEKALQLYKDEIRRTYAHKGEQVVNMNIHAVDLIAEGTGSLWKHVPLPHEWLYALSPANATSTTAGESDILPADNNYKNITPEAAAFVRNVMEPAVMNFEGDELPVSAFTDLVGGVMPMGTTKYEKRRISERVPEWLEDKCTQCNYCAFVCPHGVIRPFVVTSKEAKAAPHPEQFKSLRAQGPELMGKRYSLQVSVLDCTGCNVCVTACPEDAIRMTDIEQALPHEVDNFEYALSLPEHAKNLVDRNTVRGSQFQTPLFEFSGACAGCGETPYIKLLTQLFGERMLIANATGCSSIFGGTFLTNPYTVNKEGQGPAWANSLFEDNAEFGLGMLISTAQRRSHVVKHVQKALEAEKARRTPSSEEVSSTRHALFHLLERWMNEEQAGVPTGVQLCEQIVGMLESLRGNGNTTHDFNLDRIYQERDQLTKYSIWVVGGDGWAYDIGSGGLDHVLALGMDINILVLDTEMYSNTGGQQSKATPKGASVKFALGGKRCSKKNLSLMAMQYEEVYVASCALGNMQQTMRAFVEAEQYRGPSLVICYAPCIEHGIREKGLDDMFIESRAAVETGYWPLFRFNPDLVKEGRNPFELDARKMHGSIAEFLSHEARFTRTSMVSPQLGEELHQQLNHDIVQRLSKFNLLMRQIKEGRETEDTAGVLVGYGSETGNAERVAGHLCSHLTAAGFNPHLEVLEDLELDDLQCAGMMLVVTSTCGQGAVPHNAQRFWDLLQRTETSSDDSPPPLQGLQYCVLGLGDSAYYFFCEAAIKMDVRLEQLGATRIAPRGTGDDSDEGGLDTGVDKWCNEVLWSALGKSPPDTDQLLPRECELAVQYSRTAILTMHSTESAVEDYYHAQGAMLAKCKTNRCLTPRGVYTLRDFRHIELEVEAKDGFEYETGDALDIYPANDPNEVAKLLETLNLEPLAVVEVSAAASQVQQPAKGPRYAKRVWPPDEMCLLHLFTYVLDTFSKPSKTFFAHLAQFATDPEEKKVLFRMSHFQGDDYARFTAQYYTIADALHMFKSAHPPLPYLLDMIPTIKPRAYSIASSPRAQGSQVHLCILIDEWITPRPEERHRVGLCTGYLRREVQENMRMWVSLRGSSMERPEALTPLICACIGSGLAPFMAFVRERAAIAKQNGSSAVAPMHLYFGNRYSKTEFLYQEELETLDLESEWFTLHTAFSRDDPDQRTYVQHLMLEYAQEVYDTLVEKKGSLYICGNRNLPKGIQTALVKCFSNSSALLTSEEAQEQMVQLFLNNRVNQEVW